jgi:hypothetical protein
VDVAEARETLKKQSRADEQNERERDFGNDERMTNPRTLATGDRAARACFERGI